MPSFNKKKGKWTACVKRYGHRKQATFPTKAEALNWEVQWRKSPEDRWQKETSTTCCLLDWSTRYLEYAEQRFAPKTFYEKGAAFKRFYKTVNAGIAVIDMTLGIAMKYFEIQKKQRSGYASNKDRKNLLAAWNWGIKYLGLPSPNPFLTERFSEERKQRYVPPEKDFWKVYNTAQGTDKKLLLAYLHTAGRKMEIFNLGWIDIHFDLQEISLYTRKTSDGSLEEARIPMTDDLYNMFLEMKQGATSEWVFAASDGMPYVNRWKWLNRLCDKAVVKRFTLHSIRHLTASILAKNGIPAIVIQAILRHKRLATTERYLHRILDMRPALKVLSGGKVLPDGTSAQSGSKSEETKALNN